MKEDLEALRHSASHVLADAVKRLFPGTKLGIGPAIADGFYYDFDFERSFTPEDLDRVHCPIGLEIGAETPQEIAVSIVAELINARANKLERNP